MRMSNICDSMNVTGCEALHEVSKTGTFWQKLLINHQIELGIILGIILILLSFSSLIYHLHKKIKENDRDFANVSNSEEEKGGRK